MASHFPLISSLNELCAQGALNYSAFITDGDKGFRRIFRNCWQIGILFLEAPFLRPSRKPIWYPMRISVPTPLDSP